MRWKTVLLAGLIWPAGTGCNLAYNAARTVINEPHVSMTKHAIIHDLRKSARQAFEESRASCPEHADSEDFRDGFIDGYVDYLDKGGNGGLPAVPPAKYTRHAKYFTENGQCLVKSYFLGFKYGQEVAIATGRRQYLTVPVLLPVEQTGPPAFNVQPAEQAAPVMPTPHPPGVAARLTSVPKPLPAAPALLASRVLAQEFAKAAPPPAFDPAPKPMAESIAKGPPPTEFHPTPMAEPERINIPSPPLPVPARRGPSGPEAWGNLPAIPPLPAVPPATAPAEPTPAVLPPNHTVRPPLPPNHPQPRQ